MIFVVVVLICNFGVSSCIYVHIAVNILQEETERLGHQRCQGLLLPHRRGHVQTKSCGVVTVKEKRSLVEQPEEIVAAPETPRQGKSEHNDPLKRKKAIGCVGEKAEM